MITLLIRFWSGLRGLFLDDGISLPESESPTMAPRYAAIGCEAWARFTGISGAAVRSRWDFTYGALWMRSVRAAAPFYRAPGMDEVIAEARRRNRGSDAATVRARADFISGAMFAARFVAFEETSLAA
jgi:hypothetical protein